MVLPFVAALLPAAAWGVYQFGTPALALLAAGVAGAAGTEVLADRLGGGAFCSRDRHGVLVGLVLAMMLPPGAPWWLALVGGAAGILLGKLPFGPLGGSPFNPALVGLLIVAVSWPEHVGAWRQPRTALAELKGDDVAPAEHPLDAVRIDPSDIIEYDAGTLFLGRQPGPVGGISPLLLLLGGLFLIWRRVIRWQAPAGFLLGVALAAGVAAALNPSTGAPVWFHLAAGLAVFGAFFLCTDRPSTPVSPRGLFAFALGAGVLAVALRTGDLHFGSVPWAIAIASLATPLVDRLVPPARGKAPGNA